MVLFSNKFLFLVNWKICFGSECFKRMFCSWSFLLVKGWFNGGVCVGVDKFSVS